PFAEADGNAVAALRPVRGRNAGGNHGVPQSGAVEVDGQALPARPFGNGLQLVQWEHPAATAVVRVLEANQACAHKVLVVGSDLVLQLPHVENAVVALHGPAGDAAEHGGCAPLVVVDVAGGLAENLVAGLGVDL